MREIYIKGDKGPSKLDERLEDYRMEEESGKIMITSEEAEKVLRETLINLYRSGDLSPKMEVLIAISESEDKEKKFDYTQMVEMSVAKMRGEEEQREEEQRERDKSANIIRAPKSPQREF